MGLGGVGGFVGGALAKVEPKTCFLARGENLAAILKDGLTVESDRLGRFCVVPVLATDDARQIGVADAVILAVKGASGGKKLPHCAGHDKREAAARALDAGA